jgi:GT2 family glycosyltransferase
MSNPEICVIIVNYGTADLTVAAVQSVLDRTKDDRVVHVAVVDNASPDNDAQMLQDAHAKYQWADQVTLYLESKNHGFGGGNNVVLQGYKAAGAMPDKVLFLNPDAALENNAIEILAEFLDDTPAAGFAGASISKPDGTAVTAAFRFPNAIAEFSQNLNFGPIASLFKRWHVPLAPSHPKGKVDWVSGASVMARKEALEDVGFFDVGFFLYFEEVDLMRQASLKGWETWHVPSAKIIHVEGVATGVKSGEEVRRRKPAYWYHSWQYYHWKNNGTFGAIVAGIGYLIGMTGQNIIVTLRGHQSHSPLNGISDFWKLAMLPILRGKNTSKANHD